MHGKGTTTWPDGRSYEGEYNIILMNIVMKMIKNMVKEHLYGVMEENI